MKSVAKVDTNSNRLNQVMEQISLLLTNVQRQTLEKMKENRDTIMHLLSEADTLMLNLQDEIELLKEPSPNTTLPQIEGYLNLLSLGLNFDEAMDITRKLFEVNSAIPSNSNVYDDVQEEIIYEEAQ